MIYRDFKGTKLSMLGFGTMRLPVLENGQIDAALTQKMVDYAMAHGVNYYDTAWPYMQNRSETVVGQCLKKHPRDSFYLATKFPGHMVAETYDPADIFEQQLQNVRWSISTSTCCTTYMKTPSTCTTIPAGASWTTCRAEEAGPHQASGLFQPRRPALPDGFPEPLWRRDGVLPAAIQLSGLDAAARQGKGRAAAAA